MESEFVDKKLLIYGFDSFFNRREEIKEIFMTKTPKEQALYRMYLYSRPFISDCFKNAMWDYLQEDITPLDFLIFYCNNKSKNKNTQ